MTAVVLTFSAGEGGHVEIDAQARQTALSVAEEIARGTLDAEPNDVERFELGPAEESLPAVAALIQVSDLGPLYIQYVYGAPAGEAGLPRAVDPAEVLDGAVTCGEYHWAAMRNPTLFFQRNELIRTLYREHGKTLRFAGVVLMRGLRAERSRQAECGRAWQRRSRASSAPTASSSRPTRAAIRTPTSCSRAAPASRPASVRQSSSPRRPIPSRRSPS